MDNNNDPVEIITNQIQPLLENYDLSCTISSGDVNDQQTRMNMIASQVKSVEIIEERGILSFDETSEIAHLLLDFVMKEHECCRFLEFDMIFKQNKKVIELHISSDRLDHDGLEKAISMIIPS